MITIQERKVARVEKPKAGFYPVHFDDDTSKLLTRLTKKLGVLDKRALVFWAANIERDYVKAKAIESYRKHRDTRSPTDAFEKDLDLRLGEQKAHQMRLKEAGDIGTSLHKAIQIDLKARLVTTNSTTDFNVLKQQFEDEKKSLGALEGPALLAYMAWEDWAESVSLEPTHVETRLGSERMDVGGTMDCAGNADIPIKSQTDAVPVTDHLRAHCIFDWKSSKRSKTAPNGIYPEAEIQVCVYRAMAIEMGLADDDSWAAVVRLPKNEDDPVLKENEPFDVKWIDPDRARYLAEGFLHIGRSYSFMQEAFPK